ncbi:phosphosulfolactate synthase [Paenibacillus sp. TRM 82003]|nr:phosphosulfolactate synthase [Paenibacillus sp. TRM 82003]
MEHISKLDWHPALADPTGRRSRKPRRTGQTMVIDKGLGLRAYEDMLRASAPHIDVIKLGFGTSALYPKDLLQRKVELATEAGILVMPGGTFLEVAVAKNKVDAFLSTVTAYGFTALEVSDGTIELSRNLRSALVVKGIDAGLTVVTEYGKKIYGSSIQLEELARTVEIDTGLGAAFVTIEARESGKGVGIFDENGAMKTGELEAIMAAVDDGAKLMWEAPLKSQQTELLQALGSDLNIGNVAPDDVMSLEALRRGLRSDTFDLGAQPRV